MASSIDRNPTSQTPPANNTDFISQFLSFKQQLGSSDPKSIVQNMLQSGRMNRSQFDLLSKQATSILSSLNLR